MIDRCASRGVTSLVALACVFGSCSRVPQPLRVVERLVDRAAPDRATADKRDAALAARVPVRWTAADIERQWAHVAGARGATFRSPRLDVGTLDDLAAFVITLTPGNARATLLWSDQPMLAGADYIRNRRDLLQRADRSVTLVIRAKDLRSDVPSAVRYLFLHVPDAKQAAAAVDAVAVVRRADVIGASPSGSTRLTVGGEIRDAFYTSARALEWPMEPPASAELHAGFRAGRSERGARITFVTGGRTSTLFEARVEQGGARDVRVQLPPSRGVLRFESDAAATDDVGLWINPLIAAPWPEKAPPNVVLYVVDTLRADRLGLYGSPRHVTPFLDGLGVKSLVFRRAYAAASWTKPSVATILTGLFPETHRLGARYYTDPLPDVIPTLQSELAARGYQTAQFSANAFSGTLSNLDRGFDLTLAPDAFAQPSGAARGKISADALNARILPWIDRHAGASFFLYVQSLEPHQPRAPIPPGADPFDAYDAEVAVSDREIARLYEHLVRRGLASRTLFIVTSDHGEALGEHGMWGHGLSVHEEEVRVPLIVHWPGGLAPAVVDDSVSLVDLMPTVLDVCRVPVDPTRLQGRSLVPGSHEGQTRRPILAARFVYPEDLDFVGADHVESRALIDYPWKLIATEVSASDVRYELYDLAHDPGERDNRAVAQPDRVRSLAAVLTNTLKSLAVARARFVESVGGVDDRRREPSRDVLEQLKSLGYIH